MRLAVIVATSLCALLPGCQLFSPHGDTSREHAQQQKVTEKKKRSGHYVADPADSIEELTFEEDASDLMEASSDEESLDLVEDTTLGTEIQSRQLQQAQYGFKPIYFPFDRYHIPDAQYDTLKHDLKVITRLTKRKSKTIVIEGHADCYAGSHEYNMHLSEKRARSVKTYLIENGVPESRLKVVGRGATMCLVPSGNKEQQAPNRRVEFYVLHE